MVRRVLVTTALEQTWPTNSEPVLFLGEWCRIYNRKSKWEQFDQIVAPYHWNDRNKLRNDYVYLMGVYEELLAKLARTLNEVHKKNYSLRYWRIIVGPWLGYFVQVLFDRWSVLGSALKDNKIATCKIIKKDYFAAVPADFAEFQGLSVNDDWNETVFGQLLVSCFSDFLAVEFVVRNGEGHKNYWDISWKTKVRNALYSIYEKLAKPFGRSKSHFFISTRLTLFSEIKLQLKLGQFPRLRKSKRVKCNCLDKELRSQIFTGEALGQDAFMKILHEMMPLHLPVAYLEGYQCLVDAGDDMGWPSDPKTIFTSNSFLADDLFKTWCAGRCEEGAPLIIGQHGGHFGMSPFAFYEEHQIEISDVWLSWGWANQANYKIKPVGVINRTTGCNPIYKPGGRLLMVEMTLPRYSYHLYAAPIAGQFLYYFSDQCRFVEGLNERARDKLTIRLAPRDTYQWNQRERWNDRFDNVTLDDGEQDMSKLISQCRLYVSTYNATTYLESLTLDVPTIIFWDQNYWELTSEAAQFIGLLESVGIFHKTPMAAAAYINDIWDNVEAWWRQESVQAARREFCNQYARTSKDLLNNMSQLIGDLAKQSHASHV